MIPKAYQWLLKEPGPKILTEALKLYGTKEFIGPENNPVIVGWAKEIGGWIGDWYKDDSTAWCGLYAAVCAKRAGFPFSQKALSALEWKNWGKERENPKLGDICVFQRPGGGHVGLYVGEDDKAYHILGGNQGDQVSITRILKPRLVSVRHCAWEKDPPNVRRIGIKLETKPSENEA